MICACVCSSFCKLPVLVAWNSKYQLVDVSVCVFSWVFCEHYGSKGEFSWGKYGLLPAPGKTEKSHLLLQFVVNPICSEFSLFRLLSPPTPLSLSLSLRLLLSFLQFHTLPLFLFPLPPPSSSLRGGGGACCSNQDENPQPLWVQSPASMTLSCAAASKVLHGLGSSSSLVCGQILYLIVARVEISRAFFLLFFFHECYLLHKALCDCCNCHVSSYVFENNKMDASVDAQKKKRRENAGYHILWQFLCLCV